MTDQRLQAARRAAALDPSPEARAAWLRERLRAGELTQERLELAAYCGDEAARKALGLVPIPPEQYHRFDLSTSWGVPEGQAWPKCGCAPEAGGAICAGHGPTTLLPDFARGLSRWGQQALVRAAVAAARVALEAVVEGQKACHCGSRLSDHSQASGHEFVHACPFAPLVCECGWLEGDAPLRAIEAAEAHLACPCEEHLHAWGRAWRDTQHMGWLLPVWGGHVWILDAARIAGEAPVREAIQRALIEWALR